MSKSSAQQQSLVQNQHGIQHNSTYALQHNVVALVVGAKAGLLPAALAVGYGATAASLLALLAALIYRNCFSSSAGRW
jgi:hypothetical protein